MLKSQVFSALAALVLSGSTVYAEGDEAARFLADESAGIVAEESAGIVPDGMEAQIAQEGTAEPLALGQQLAPGQNYNRWICFATSSFNRRFVGYSAWFSAGSGQGQQAHQIAYNNALLQCRSHSPFGLCRSQFQNDCQVQRTTSN